MAADRQQLHVQFASFDQGLLFADNGNHDVCLMLFGCFFGLRPHVIVLRAFFGFTIRYGGRHQAYRRHHVTYVKDQRLGIPFLVRFLFSGDVPLFFQISDVFFLVPAVVGEQGESHECAGLLLTFLGLLCLFHPIGTHHLDKGRSILDSRLFVIRFHLTEGMAAVRQAVSFVSTIHTQQPFTVLGILVFEDVVGHIVQYECSRTLDLRRLMSQLLCVREPGCHCSQSCFFLSVVHILIP